VSVNSYTTSRDLTASLPPSLALAFKPKGGVSGSVPRAAPGVPRRVCREASGGEARDLVSTKTGSLTRAVAQASESIQRSRRRASRAMSSGSRKVLVSSEIPS
jgi:hypothetical protein